MAIGQPAVVEDLQEHVAHIGVGLFHLIEEHYAVGPTPHRFSQPATLLIADIPRRRADQPGDRVLLHELAHVDADHGVGRIEEELRESLAQLGLAYARGPEEEERPDGARCFAQAGPIAAHRIAHRADRVILADEPLANLILHLQELLPFAFDQLVHGNARPFGDDLRNLLRIDLLSYHRLSLGLPLRELYLGRLEALIQIAQLAVLDACSGFEITAALGLLQFGLLLVDLAFDRFDLVQLGLLDLPLCAEPAAFLIES